MAKFPTHYVPRPYQEELHKMWRSKRYGLAVLPRQSGKDVAASMEQCDARLRTPKTTGVYISLNNPMIRDILWDKTYIDPVTGEFIRGLQDNVPAEYVDWKDTVMEGRFSNHSRLKLQGYFQSGQDKSGVGTSFQDYTITELALFSREDPIPRLVPILENRAEPKRLMVVSTPRGRRRNPLWQLMESLKGNPEAQVITRTMDDLNAIMKREGLPPILTEAELERIEDTYLKRFGNTRMFEQEYHVSFEEMDAAAVYGEALMKMIAEQRIADFNLHLGKPVYVMFDIGASGIHSDATSWIAFQWFNEKLFLLDSGEGHGKAVPEYVDVLRTKPWFPHLARIILPWDAEHHEKAVNTTPADMMREKFPHISVLAKSSKVWKLPNSRQGDYDLVTDIQQTRMALYNTYIHETNNERLVECLEQYKYEFDSKRQEWTSKPLHDQYSHMMDALRYIVQATKELDFFGGQFFDDKDSKVHTSTSYTEDWSGVWRAS
jgi:hypothetical protein